MINSVDNIDMFDKKAYTMRMFISKCRIRGFDEKSGSFVTFWPLPHIPFNSYSKLHREWTTSSQLVNSLDMRDMCEICGFGEKVAVLWCFDHCRTFHSATLVNCTENEPLSVNQAVSTCLSGNMTLSKMCGFDEKVIVLWRFDRCRTFHSTPLVNCTENWPLSASQWTVSTCFAWVHIPLGFWNKLNLEISMCHNLSSDHFDDKSLKNENEVSHTIHFRVSYILFRGGIIVNLRCETCVQSWSHTRAVACWRNQIPPTIQCLSPDGRYRASRNGAQPLESIIFSHSISR